MGNGKFAKIDPIENRGANMGWVRTEIRYLHLQIREQAGFIWCTPIPARCEWTHIMISGENAEDTVKRFYEGGSVAKMQGGKAYVLIELYK